MNCFDGIVRPQYEVHCLNCGEVAMGLGSDRRDAERQLVQERHFKCIRGRWFCASCVEQTSPSRLRTIADKARSALQQPDEGTPK